MALHHHMLPHIVLEHSAISSPAAMKKKIVNAPYASPLKTPFAGAGARIADQLTRSRRNNH